MSDETTDGGDARETTRRTVVRSVAGSAAAAAVGGLSGAATAESALGGPSAVRAAFDAEPAVLEAVSAAGYLDEPSFEALGVEEVGEQGATRTAVGRTTVDGKTTPEVLIRRTLDDGRLLVRLTPEADASFAVFEPDDGDHEQLYTGTFYGDVTASDCTVNCENCSVDTPCTFCEPIETYARTEYYC